MAFRLKLTNTTTGEIFNIMPAVYSSDSDVRALLQNLNNTVTNNYAPGNYQYDPAIYDSILSTLPAGINGCIAIRADGHVRPPLYLNAANNAWHSLSLGSYSINDDLSRTILIQNHPTRLMGFSGYDAYINALYDLAVDAQSGINAYTNIDIGVYKSPAGRYYFNGFNAAFTAIYYNSTTMYLKCVQGYATNGNNYIKDKFELYIGPVSQQIPHIMPEASEGEISTETGDGTADSEDNIGGEGVYNYNDVNITVVNDEYTSETSGLLGSGIATLKKIDEGNLQQLGAFLYSDGMVEALQKFFAGNAENAIIDLYQLPIEAPHADTATIIKFGSASSGVSGYNVTKPVYEIDCGSVDVTNINTNSFLDFSPYCRYYVFLPFIGVKEIETDLIRSVEDSGTTLSLKYKIDVLTGDCVAKLIISERNNYAFNDNNGTLSIKNTKTNFIIKEFTGNCKKSLPKGSSNKLGDFIGGFANMFSGLASAGSSNPSQIVNGFSQATSGIQNITGNHLSMSAITSNLGYLSLRTPYLMCFSPVIYSRGNKYGQKNGYASEKYCKLNSTRGYVKVKSVIASGFTGTAHEQEMVVSLLKKGVWCK